MVQQEQQAREAPGEDLDRRRRKHDATANARQRFIEKRGLN